MYNSSLIKANKLSPASLFNSCLFGKNSLSAINIRTIAANTYVRNTSKNVFSFVINLTFLAKKNTPTNMKIDSSI